MAVLRERHQELLAEDPGVQNASEMIARIEQEEAARPALEHTAPEPEPAEPAADRGTSRAGTTS
jgi:hypothetical protein